ncbi:MAG: transcriptional regulator, partial [Steroidobacteraceae bacterium]
VIDRRAESDGASLYELTRAGKELQPLIEMLGIWGHRWVGSQLQDDDLDVGLLMWDIRRGVNRSVFPESRIVIEFVFNDAPADMGHWWLVSSNHEIDLCLEDPGHEVDVLVKSSVRTLTSVWLSQYTFSQALKVGDLRLTGSEKIKQQLPIWLQGSPLARLGAQSLQTDPIRT